MLEQCVVGFGYWREVLEETCYIQKRLSKRCELTKLIWRAGGSCQSEMSVRRFKFLTNINEARNRRKKPGTSWKIKRRPDCDKYVKNNTNKKRRPRDADGKGCIMFFTHRWIKFHHLFNEQQHKDYLLGYFPLVLESIASKIEHHQSDERP